MHAADHGSQEVEALSDVFEGGELEGHIRNCFMCTMNAGEAHAMNKYDFEDYHQVNVR